MERLGYRHDDDRCYGVAGMAIGLVIFDGEDYLEGINVDARSDELISLSNQFYFGGSPTFSAKSVWTRVVNNFNIMSAMVISNALCRSLVQDGMPVRFEIKQQIRDILTMEASETCELEKDEIERLFEKNYNYLYRVFNHGGVQDVAREMVERLRRTRTMSRLDVLEQLRSLSML